MSRSSIAAKEIRQVLYEMEQTFRPNPEPFKRPDVGRDHRRGFSLKNRSLQPGRPFPDSAIARYLGRQIEALKGVKTQREIATEAGYEKANIISMFKHGEAKVPLDKIPVLAKALHVDPTHLFRLALEQYWPSLNEAVAEIFGQMATKNEEVIFLRKWREETHNTDPRPNPEIERLVDKLINEIAVSVHENIADRTK